MEKDHAKKVRRVLVANRRAKGKTKDVMIVAKKR